MANVFKLDGFKDLSKSQQIKCTAGDLRLTVDWDDADHYDTATCLAKMLRILNEHWDDEDYKDSAPDPTPSEDLDDEAQDEAWEQRYEAAKAIMRDLGKQRW